MVSPGTEAPAMAWCNLYLPFRTLQRGSWPLIQTAIGIKQWNYALWTLLVECAAWSLNVLRETQGKGDHLMQGNPEAPRCGFSQKVVAALQAVKVPFNTFDILIDEEVRQGLKEYSQWPTYPQLYVKGELLGGCDVILEMQEDGECIKSLFLAYSLTDMTRCLHVNTMWCLRSNTYMSECRCEVVH